MTLACLAPIGLAYTVVISQSTPWIFSQDLKAEARAAQRALNTILTSYAEDEDWDEMRYTVSTISREGLVVALLDKSARLRFAPSGFSIAIPALHWISAQIKSDGAAEFTRRADGRLWFCRIEPLGTGRRGYLLLAQDWATLREDRARGIVTLLLANIGLLLAGIAGILFLVHHYVTRPLAELHRRVMLLDDSGAAQCTSSGSETELTAVEFRRISEQLAVTRCRSLQEGERRLQRERRLMHADKLAAIAALASEFAHEIGTPLGVIRGHAEMLSSSNLERSEVMETLEVIITQIDHIIRMVKTLLEFGRRRTAVRTVSDLRAIASRSIRLLQPEAVRRGVAVLPDLGSKPLMVDCDADQLEEVFVKLEVNALEAMTPGGGILQVNSVADEVHGKIRLSFEDTGPGVPAAIRDRIFAPFFTTKDRSQNDGIGLAVSRSVIGDHEGELILEQHTHGACFVVILPASRSLQLERAM